MWINVHILSVPNTMYWWKGLKTLCKGHYKSVTRGLCCRGGVNTLLLKVTWDSKFPCCPTFNNWRLFYNHKMNIWYFVNRILETVGKKKDTKACVTNDMLLLTRQATLGRFSEKGKSMFWFEGWINVFKCGFLKILWLNLNMKYVSNNNTCYFSFESNLKVLQNTRWYKTILYYMTKL